MPVRPLSSIVQAFFQQYLVAERNLSPNTVLSYRDGIRLVLQYVSERVGRDPDRLSFEDFDAERVREFLDWLETERKCSPRTRNQRLAAIKTFFRYVASTTPEHLDRCRRIREIATKRITHQAPQYLEPDEMKTLTQAIDPKARDGARDLALICLMHNTGARVQEVADLNLSHLRLEATAQVRLMGKGRKERTCPLWAQTVAVLRRWIALRGGSVTGDSPLFVNARGERITRYGIAFILRRAALRANLQIPSQHLRRVTPHTIRHTTAMDLLRAGVDLTVIAAWLGHADLTTTNGYVQIDMRMKQAAIAATSTGFLPDRPVAKYPRPSVVAWLDALGKHPDYVERSRAPSVPVARPAACST